jgi:glycosyltransferase involved in cell wall biosynthesis
MTLRILVGADVEPNPNSGAAGTVVATNAALRALGHQVDEIWANDLSHRIRHWNLHYLLELPRSYRTEVGARLARAEYDVVQLSQPHAWLAARDHRRRQGRGVFVNRSHGLESMADASLSMWHRKLGVAESRFPRSLFSPLLRARLHRHIDLVVRHADGVLVPARDIREHLVNHHGADPERIEVVHHGVPETYLQTPQARWSEHRARRMLYVGQHAFIKGPMLAAEAARRVLESDPATSLTWVTSRDAHAAITALFPANLLARVVLRDWMTQKELISLYDDHGIFLSHSIYEGAAKACTEAMSRGLVVVSSRVGAMKDHVEHGSNGFLVDIGDIDGMAASALQAASDAGQGEAIGRRAMKVAQSLRWSECARGAVRFYERLLQEKGSRHA